MILSILILIVELAATWAMFRKMGREGWEGIIPLYNTYVQFQCLYGDGWKFLLLLIPFYNIYILIKFYIDLAHAFHKETGFIVGLILLNPIFLCILGFDSSVYGDGSMANTNSDFVSDATEKVKSSFANGGAGSTAGTARVVRDANALDKIRELGELRDQGIITEEEFQEKKQELLKRV